MISPHSSPTASMCLKKGGGEVGRRGGGRGDEGGRGEEEEGGGVEESVGTSLLNPSIHIVSKT